MNFIKFIFFILMSLPCAVVFAADTMGSPMDTTAPTTAPNPPVEVVYLKFATKNPNSMFGSSSYEQDLTTGTSIVLLIHTKDKVFNLDQQNTQLLTFSDNLGTALIPAGIKAKADWQAAHPDVASFSA